MEIIGIGILIKELEEIKVCIGITRFFIGNTFISNARLKLAKNHAKAKKHAELWLFENYSLSHPLYHPKIIGDFLKNIQKTNASVLMAYNDVILLMAMKIRLKMNNRS